MTWGLFSTPWWLWRLRAEGRLSRFEPSFLLSTAQESFRKWGRKPAEEDRLCLKLCFPFFCPILFFLSFFYLKLQTEYLKSFSSSHSSTTNNVRFSNTLFNTLVAGSSRTHTLQVTPPACPTTWQRRWRWRRQFVHKPTIGARRRRLHAIQNAQGADVPQAGGVQQKSEFES